MNRLTRTLEKPALPVKLQITAAIAAVIGAVALPQIFHLIGAVSGTGTTAGVVFLPMHLPVILVGLLAGPMAGAVSGMLSPLAGFALSGMPGIIMLPFMMIELTAYGAAAGFLYRINIPVIIKVLIAQVVGRLVYAGAILIAAYGLNVKTPAPGAIIPSLASGLPGLILQWVLLPLLVFRIINRDSGTNNTN